MTNCCECGKPILDTDKKAYGADGVMHYMCFKRGTAHPKTVSKEELDELLER